MLVRPLYLLLDLGLSLRLLFLFFGSNIASSASTSTTRPTGQVVDVGSKRSARVALERSGKRSNLAVIAVPLRDLARAAEFRLFGKRVLTEVDCCVSCVL